VAGLLLLTACVSAPPAPQPKAAEPAPKAAAVASVAPATANLPNTAPAASATAAAPATAATPATAAASSAPAAAAAAPATPPPPPPIMPFSDAVLFAANNMFKAASAVGDSADALPLVIDPLIDGNSGVQSIATQTMEARIGELVRSSYPRFQLQPFSTSTLSRGPLLFIGTFTAVDKEGKNAGAREWYRVCLALLDLRSGKIVSKGFARSKPEGVDITPTQFFLDSPAWAPDAATEGYVKTCQGTKAGDPINPAYWDKIVAAAMVNDAIQAYNGGRYDEALDLYRGVARLPAGEQLRVHNGIYLSAWRLGRKEEAAQAFSRIVDFGIASKRLGVKFLFRPGSTLFVNEPQVAAPYPIWIKQIASRSNAREVCLEVSGHSSRTGPEPLNERLSMMRAQYVKQRLETDAPPMSWRTRAIGKGSQENITGLGTDDLRDALDRRVEFKVIDCKAV
jgi:outer membrane protein OmpA-like peptidoglycan-associated protein